MGDHIMFCFFATIEPPLGIGDGVEKLCRARNPTNGVSSCAIQMTREIYMWQRRPTNSYSERRFCPELANWLASHCTAVIWNTRGRLYRYT